MESAIKANSYFTFLRALSVVDEGNNVNFIINGWVWETVGAAQIFMPSSNGAHPGPSILHVQDN